MSASGSGESDVSDYWIHNIDSFLIRFPESWPIDGIKWYGLAYLAGFVIAALLLRAYYLRGRSPYNYDQQTTLLTALIIGVLAGGRIGYMLLYNLDGLLANPLSLFAIWQGGMASHGGMIGVVVAMIWFARHTRTTFWRLADIVVTLAPAGILLGRIANFINAELWGKVTTVSWAVLFPVTDPRTGLVVDYTEPRHPSQLYQAGLEGLLLLVYIQARFWLSQPAQRPAGRLAAEFLIAYGLLRILGEIFREPDADLILGLSRGAFYSVLMVIAGVIIVWHSRRSSSTGSGKQ